MLDRPLVTPDTALADGVAAAGVPDVDAPGDSSGAEAPRSAPGAAVGVASADCPAAALELAAAASEPADALAPSADGRLNEKGAPACDGLCRTGLCGPPPGALSPPTGWPVFFDVYSSASRMDESGMARFAFASCERRESQRSAACGLFCAALTMWLRVYISVEPVRTNQRLRHVLRRELCFMR